MKKICFSLFLALLVTSESGYTAAHTQAFNQLIYKVRDPQTDADQFRKSLEKIGEYLALEILEELDTTNQTLTTLTGHEATHPIVNVVPVLVTILRAGVPLNNGVQSVFPQSPVGFFAMSRDEVTLLPQVDYIALPDLRDRVVIITDTMLATAGSLLEAVRVVESRGAKQIYIVAALASKVGIDRLLDHNPLLKIFAGNVDPLLNEKGFIIPGLGDAGDRCYGEKYKVDR